VKLLLDEHYSPAIARQLGTRGHDVVAVAERADLVSLSDDDLRRMAQERRAIMTNAALHAGHWAQPSGLESGWWLDRHHGDLA
jgi:hypothetical protein